MFVIREAQLQALRKIRVEEFEAELVARHHLPSNRRGAPDEHDTRKGIRATIAVGQKFGIITEGGLASFVGLQFADREKFQLELEAAGTQKLLLDPKISGDVKIDFLQRRLRKASR